MTTTAQIELLARALWMQSSSQMAWEYAAKPFREEAYTILAQLIPLDPLGAVAMREKAEKMPHQVADEWSCGHDARNCDCNRYIEQWRYAADEVSAIPLPTHTDRLAAALAMPEIARLVEAAQWARNRLNIIADESWHGDGRDLKRSIVGIFADFDEALMGVDSSMPPALAVLTPIADGEMKGDA